MTQDLQIVGLVVDAAGIFVLGVPALFFTRKDIAAQTGTQAGGNPALAKALLSARLDTMVGSILLLAGFVIQIASLSGSDTPPFVSAPSIAILLVLFIVLYFYIFRTHLIAFLMYRFTNWNT